MRAALTIVLFAAAACGVDPATESTTETESSTDGSTRGPTTTFSLDWGSPDDEFPCDPFAQDCADDEKCVPYSNGGDGFDDNKCVPITGDGQPGEACQYDGMTEATDDCGKTSYCWAAGGAGTCEEFCTGTADDSMCPAGDTCIVDVYQSLNLCLAVCDPLLQDCSPGFTCQWMAGFACWPTTEG